MLKNVGFSVMIVFTFFSLVNIGVSLKLPETFGKDVPDIVEEISSKITDGSRDIGKKGFSPISQI